MKQGLDDAAAIYAMANKKTKDENDLKRLMDFTGSLIFFNQINKRYGNTRIQRLFCQNMTILKVPPHHVIFKKDEEGDAFYLVIEGTVNILKKENVSSFSITKVVERGLFFGELALINGTKRSATAQNGSSIAYLACIHKNSFRVVFANVLEEVFLHTYFSATQDCFIFKNWLRKDVSAFFSSSFLIEVRFGSVLLRQNEVQADGILIVLSGKIQLFQSFNQEEIPLITLSTNDILNEEQFTDSSPPLYTSKCVSPSAKLLFINNEDFFDKVLPDTQVYQLLMSQIEKKQLFLKKRLSEIEQGLTRNNSNSNNIPVVKKVSPFFKKSTSSESIPNGSRTARTEPSINHNYDHIQDNQAGYLHFNNDNQKRQTVSSVVSPRGNEVINAISGGEAVFLTDDVNTNLFKNNNNNSQSNNPYGSNRTQTNNQNRQQPNDYEGPLSPIKIRYMAAIREKTLEQVDPTVVCTMQTRKSLEDYKKIFKEKINYLNGQQQSQQQEVSKVNGSPSYQQSTLSNETILAKDGLLLHKKSPSSYLETQQNSSSVVGKTKVSNNPIGFLSPKNQKNLGTSSCFPQQQKNITNNIKIEDMEADGYQNNQFKRSSILTSSNCSDEDIAGANGMIQSAELQNIPKVISQDNYKQTSKTKESLPSQGSLGLSPRLGQQHSYKLAISPPPIIIDSLNNSTPDDRSRVHNSFLSIASSIDRQNNMDFLKEEEEFNKKEQAKYEQQQQELKQHIQSQFKMSTSKGTKQIVLSPREIQYLENCNKNKMDEQYIKQNHLKQVQDNLFGSIPSSNTEIAAVGSLGIVLNTDDLIQKSYQTKETYPQFHKLEGGSQGTFQSQQQSFGLMNSIQKSLINLEKCSNDMVQQRQVLNQPEISKRQQQYTNEDIDIVNSEQSRQVFQRLLMLNSSQKQQQSQSDKKIISGCELQQQQQLDKGCYRNDSNNILKEEIKIPINKMCLMNGNGFDATRSSGYKLKTEENQNSKGQRIIDGIRKSDSGGIISSILHSNTRSLHQINSKNYTGTLQHGHTAYSSPIQSLPQTSTPIENSEYFQKPAGLLKKQIQQPSNKQVQQVLKGDLKNSKSISNYSSASSTSSLLRPRVRPDATISSSSVSSVGVNLNQEDCMDSNKSSSFFFKKVGSTASISSTVKKNNYLQTSSHSASSQNRSPLIRKLSHASQVSSFNNNVITASNSGNNSAQKLRSDENNQKTYVHSNANGSHVKRGSVDVNNQNQNVMLKSQGQEIRRQSQPDMRTLSSQKEHSKSQSAATTTTTTTTTCQTNLISNSKQFKHAQARQRECENIDLAMQLYYKKTQQKKKDLLNSNSLDSSITHPLRLSRPDLTNNVNNLMQTTENTNGQMNQGFNNNNQKMYDSILSQLLVEDIPQSKQPLLEQLQQNRKNSGVLNIKRIIYSQALNAQEQPAKIIAEKNEYPQSQSSQPSSSSSSLNLAWKIYSKRVAQEE